MAATSNRFGHIRPSRFVTDPVPAIPIMHSYDTGMVTRSEWRKSLKVPVEAIAAAFGIERESVHRMEREQNRMNAEKIALYADTLGILPERLWRPPPQGSDSDEATVQLSPAERDLAASLLKKLGVTVDKPKRS